MSLELVKTKLQGYKGPASVPSELRDLISEWDFHGKGIDSCAREVPGYLVHYRPTTEDGYTWFWALRFSTANGRVSLLIPWSQDWDKKDGSQLDRAPALYTKGVVTVEQIETIISKFYEALQEAKLEMEGTKFKDPESK